MTTENGLLMPVVSHRYLLHFCGNISANDSMRLSSQVVNVNIDFKNQTVSFVLRQPATVPAVFAALSEFVKSADQLKVDVLDGETNVLSSYEFSALHCEAHSFKLDYASSDAAEHKVTMSYRKLACS